MPAPKRNQNARRFDQAIRMARATVQLPEADKLAVAAFARQRGQTFSRFTRAALTEKIQRMENDYEK